MSKAKKKPDSLNLDYAPNGGRSKTADGQLVNANGEFIDEAGILIGGRLPENPSIRIHFLKRGVWINKPIRDAEGNLIEIKKKLVKVKPATAKEINKKADKIVKERNTEKIINESELNDCLSKLIQETVKSQTSGGRKTGSTEMSKDNFRRDVVDAYRKLESKERRKQDVDLANELKISPATFYRYLERCNWSMQTIRAEAKKS